MCIRDRPVEGDSSDPTIDLLRADEAELRRVRWSEISVVFQSALLSLIHI